MLKKADKIDLTKSLIDTLKQSNGFVVCCFKGLNVSTTNILRKQMFSIGARVQVVKNRLLLLVLGQKESGMSNRPDLKESSMVIFTQGDCLEVVRLLGIFVKDNPELELNAGVLNKVEYFSDQIVELSRLPGKTEVVSLLSGSIISVLSIFTLTLEALANKKEKLS